MVESNVVRVFRGLINAIYWLSPYRWADEHLKLIERQQEPGSESFVYWRSRRYTLSDAYISGWFFLVIVLFIARDSLPAWIVIPLAGRAIGILNKELGVVIFGICKVTEGRLLSASDRVLTLALINYMTALFVFASLYSLVGGFATQPQDLTSALPWSLYQAGMMHFTLSSPFAPEAEPARLLLIGHAGFSFLFATIIIALFASLLNLRSSS